MKCPNCKKKISKIIFTRDYIIVHGKTRRFYRCHNCNASIKKYYNAIPYRYSNSTIIEYIQNEYKITDIISVGIMVQKKIFNKEKYNTETIRVIIKGKPFMQCSLAVMQFTKEEAEDEDTDNMDDHLKAHGIENIENYRAQITMEEELFIHASNIQAFVENNYNMGILLESYSIPFLKELVEAGDKKAEYALYEQLTEKWNNGENNQKIAIFDKFPIYILKLSYNNVISIDKFIKNNFMDIKSILSSLIWKKNWEYLKLEFKRYIQKIIIKNNKKVKIHHLNKLTKERYMYIIKEIKEWKEFKKHVIII